MLSSQSVSGLEGSVVRPVDQCDVEEARETVLKNQL
jgi:hypothetical protein